MGCKRQNLHTEFNLLALIRHSTQKQFGKRRLKESTGSLHGYLFRKEFSQQIASLLGIGRVNLCVRFVINIKKVQSIYACNVCTVYSKEVWLLVQSWTEGLVTVPLPGISLEWWNTSLLSLTKMERRPKAAVMIYTAWNL